MKLNSKIKQLSKKKKTEEEVQVLKWLKELKSLRVYTEQLRWERDMAIEQLHSLGGEFGEKTELTEQRIIEDATRWANREC